jgi:hypothetical protein
LAALAKSATARYGRPYQTLFARGKDTSTGQNVGAILDTSSGWGVYGKPSQVSDLDRELSKHLVARLTNASTSMGICVVQPAGGAWAGAGQPDARHHRCSKKLVVVVGQGKALAISGPFRPATSTALEPIAAAKPF